MRVNLVLLVLLISMTAAAQKGRKLTRQEYIDTYHELAMREMEKSKIPASITLAQGILESGNGNSTLARKANNHFGIKCHGWKGKGIKHDDDAKNECFRKYKSVEESFTDHSEFLTGRSRYAGLFELKIDDYKGWAKGLKKAGYATSPTYAKALIRLIEENNLEQFDSRVLASSGGKRKKPYLETIEYAGSRKVHFVNRVKYVLAREGDNFYELSEELDLFEWQLPRYNDLTAEHVFKENEKVFLQPKRNKAEAGVKTHKVAEGETLQDISQRYAVKLDKLALRNNLTFDAVLVRGNQVLLRGKGKSGNSNSNTKNSSSQPKKLQLKAPKIEINEEKPKEEFIIDFDADK